MLGKVEEEEKAGCGSVRACPRPLGRPSPPQHPTCLPVSSSSRGLASLHPHAGPPAVVTLEAGSWVPGVRSDVGRDSAGVGDKVNCWLRMAMRASRQWRRGPRGEFGGRAGKVGWGKRSEGACHCAVVVLIEKKICTRQPSSNPMAQSLRRDKVVGQSQDDTRTGAWTSRCGAPAPPWGLRRNRLCL